jgi:hypothetical protein
MRVIERNATGAISSRWPTGGCTEEAEDGGGKNEGKRRERERQREDSTGLDGGGRNRPQIK